MTLIVTNESNAFLYARITKSLPYWAKNGIHILGTYLIIKTLGLYDSLFDASIAVCNHGTYTAQEKISMFWEAIGKFHLQDAFRQSLKFLCSSVLFQKWIFFVNIIIIIIKRGWQCKAGRERLTPYQSEDPNPTTPTHRKKRKGKQ